MPENKIELKSISELLGMNFFIPSYQRGYRWTGQQVKDLLDDINEFIDTNSLGGFYCIQPLVVRKSLFQSDEENFKKKLDEIKSDSNLLLATENLLADYTKWEVIDGQQRLTTIYILLSILNSTKKYTIEYETRESSKAFLSNIDESKKAENIDYYHMIVAKSTIETWFSGRDKDFKKKFLDTLLQNLKFIWYESINEDAIKVFTRLNIGKIYLTNAELIKALFLNKSNFQGSNDFQKIRLQQQEIANEWDKIEYSLQNDEFWLFLNKPDYDKPTRIDFIFDLICEKNILKIDAELIKQLGTDDYKTFRYFYFWFKKNSSQVIDCWKEVKMLFQTFQEWFNDLELYHFVGFLIEQGNNIFLMIDEWRKENQTKEKFIANYVIDEIKKKISNYKDLNKQYEGDGNPKKTQCRPILLLHNIQTVINQNKRLKENEKYRLPVFYKFPFHLFKKESWDVEHIDAHTENPLDKEKDKKEWLNLSREFVTPELQTKIDEWLEEEKKKKEDRDTSKFNFDDLYSEITKSSLSDKLEDGKMKEDGETENEKDKLWNFCLLDSSTNRSYGNAIFPAKRKIIMEKSQGKNGAISFIPPCTEKVFQKAFNPLPNNLREWDKKDAETYLQNIKTTLEFFFK